MLKSLGRHFLRCLIDLGGSRCFNVLGGPAPDVSLVTEVESYQPWIRGVSGLSDLSASGDWSALEALLHCLVLTPYILTYDLFT